MIKILNSLSGQKEELVPRHGKEIKMFVCGPTVYDHIHIGNARTFVFFDVVAKYLRHKGYDVNYIQNITDIDNKIIERAEKEGVDSIEYAKKYTEIFKEDMRALGVTAPEYKNATDHIPEVIKQVQTLLDKGNAYVIDGDGIYFDLSTFPDYGKLSGRTAGMADDAVSRIDDSDKKRNKGDFAIWKFKQHNLPAQAGDPSWPAPFGEGRPGWHIEDTAITEKYFGPQYDIHGGGEDLKFPHHEAEIAQQESASGLKPFVKYWMHGGFLVNKESKMSKSAGNFMTLHEALEKWPKEALRFYFLSNYYRSPLSLADESLNASQAAAQRIRELRNKTALIETMDSLGGTLIDVAQKSERLFAEVMDNDFNVPEALSILFNFIEKANKTFADKTIGKKDVLPIIKMLNLYDTIFGIIPHDTQYSDRPIEIQKLIDQRELLRKSGDYKEADKTRNQIEELGYQIEDTIYGPLVTKK